MSVSIRERRNQAAAPGLSQATWDRATGVPARIWGRGLEVPGSVRDPDIAAQAASDESKAGWAVGAWAS